MKVLVTGAGGMLGTDVARAARLAGEEVVALDHAALDVTDAAAVRAAVTDAAPDAVVDCAAWTDVDGAEQAEDAARALNADGARNVADAAAAAGAAVVLPSTDYVFDGAGPHGGAAADAPEPRPYVESDPTGPLSAYGRTKLEGERLAAAANPRHFVVRTAWLFGLGGDNFVETMLGLAAERGEARVVADQVGSPTYTRHLAEGLLALARGDAYGVHHMAAAGHCSWYDFAREIFARSGVQCQVTPVTTADRPRPARRPAWSALASERPDTIRLPDWHAGLGAYLAERAVEVTA